MGAKSQSIEAIFYGGCHEKVLKLTVDRPGYRFHPPDVPFIVGAMTFLGRLEEAEQLLLRYSKRMNREGLCASQFFLGIALCRQSRYDRALGIFSRNVQLGRRSRNHRLLFYVRQGVGFYRFFCGRYANALSAGRRAFHAACRADFNYGKFLSADLMGHAQIQTGQISAGMKMLREALRYSTLFGSGDADDGVRIALHCYQAQFGLSPADDVEKLQELYRSVEPQDTYSQSSLLLEIGRQWALRGRHEASQEALNQACRLIYSSGHRRQGVTLNLRYAYNLFLAGEYHQSLNLIRSTARELDLRVDKALQLQVLGMEWRLKNALGFAEKNDPLEDQIKRLVHYTGMGVGRRIWHRSAGATQHFAQGEDPLGDLIDLVKNRSDDAVPEILKSGYLSLLMSVLGDRIATAQSILYFDLLPDSLLIAEGGNLEFQPRGISQTIRALAAQLAHGECSKEKLIETVWGYRYDRLRHDSLIYPAVSRFRQLLGRWATWVEATDRGYRLRDGVQVRFHHAQAATASPTSAGPEVASEPSVLDELNYRQLSILQQMEKRDSIDAPTCTRLFKISQVTASRDLSTLHRLALVKRLGKGRATRYLSLRKVQLN